MITYDQWARWSEDYFQDLKEASYYITVDDAYGYLLYCQKRQEREAAILDNEIDEA